MASFRHRLDTLRSNIDSSRYGFEDRLSSEEAGLASRRAAASNHVSSTIRGGQDFAVLPPSDTAAGSTPNGRALPDWHLRSGYMGMRKD